MILEFFMPMVPPTVTAQDKDIHVVRSSKSKSGHRPIFVDSPDLRAATSKIEAHLSRHVPARPLKGPIRLVTKWCWPCEDTSHVDGEWYVEKPDTHNAVKMPVDVMERLGFFADDKHIASEVIEKFWARVPGIYVRLEELS